jgi:FecR protein
MNTTSKTTLVALALGMLVGTSGWLVAQDTVSAQEPTATATTHVDATASNGARPGDSHVRIVRLSDVRGKLALDRQTGNGFEQTMQNMPIVEGERLQTADGFAEVEFEDNSTIRLAPNSRVDFPLLALRSSGAKASTMSVVRGIVYASTESTKGNEFLMEAGGTTLTVAPSTHLRLEVGDDKTVVSVFNGSVQVAHDGETTQVGKKETLTLEGGQADVVKKVAETPFDAWDKESVDYHARYSRANAFAGSGNSFGLSDLNYYGSFTNAGGCGQMWQPYLVSSSWSPYSNGVWALYPGAGYSWVSPYPWGWLPYHSGSWAFCQGVGWGWQPGGAWNGLNNIAGYGGGYGGGGVVPSGGAINKGLLHSPLRPGLPTPPAAASVRSSLVIANQAPIKISKEDTPGNFVFQRDSAGLGVPRGSLGSLNKISNHVEQHGSANMQVYAAPAGGPGHEMGSRGPAVLRQGTPGESGQAWRGNGNESGGHQGANGANNAGGATSGARQGSSAGSGNSGGGGGAPSYHGGGGGQPSGGAMPMSSPAGNAGGGGGGARGSAPSPK